MTTATDAAGNLTLTCDTCRAAFQPRQPFRLVEFAAFKRAFEREGWKPTRRAALWLHACPACAKWEDKRLL